MHVRAKQLKPKGVYRFLGEVMNQGRTGAFSVFRLVAAAVLLGLTAVSAFLFVREAEQFKRGFLSDSEAFLHWSDPEHRKVITTNAQIELLTGCIYALESWKTAFEARDAVLTVARNCAEEADGILAYNAQLSEAYFLKAYNAFLLEDDAQVRVQLAQAQATAPTDQWLAVRRVNLAQKLWPGEPSIGAYDLKHDLGLLIASNNGLDTATRLYIRYPSLRDLIIEATEPLNDADRVRFLNRLTRAVRRL